MSRLYCCVAIVLLCVSCGYAAVDDFVVANGATIIATTKDTNPAPIILNKRTIPWIPHPKDMTQKIALLSVPYREKPQILSLDNGIHLQIIEGNYKQETITVASSHAKPNAKNQARIKKEREEAQKIYNRYESRRYWNSPFTLPMNSAVTSPYGSARLFNGEVASYHSGTDFKAAIGTEIIASNDGVVVIAKERFLSGLGVVIDHGQGIFSMYYHCSKINVKVGDIVKKGDLIALSGNSGRVSGPHLHFGFLVNGVQVDPMDFMQKINALF